MSKIDLRRVVLGGLLAGLVLNLVDYLVYGMVLADDFNAALEGLGVGPVVPSTILWFVVVDFLFGILLVYVYAAIRPRFGPGPMTAARAGLVLWVAVGLLRGLGEVPMGLFPAPLIVIGTVVGLVALPVAAIAGAWLYREEGPAAPAAAEAF